MFYLLTGIVLLLLGLALTLKAKPNAQWLNMLKFWPEKVAIIFTKILGIISLLFGLFFIIGPFLGWVF